ncbi:hypothetical protein SAMN05216316_1619 [Nitrosovibrio sp. Nv6]|nr:hypothetical protein SAMN05216316_1619 [Nitrosovibrio sp. Nv6]
MLPSCLASFLCGKRLRSFTHLLLKGRLVLQSLVIRRWHGRRKFLKPPISLIHMDQLNNHGNPCLMLPLP